MANYSVAEARDRFSALIEAAERGEQVEITRYGRPVVAMVPTGDAPARPKVTSWESIQRVRDSIAHLDLSKIDGAALVNEMRDEDW